MQDAGRRGKGGGKETTMGAGEEEGGGGAVFVRPVCCVLRDALVRVGWQGPRGVCVLRAAPVLRRDGSEDGGDGWCGGGGENLVRFGIPVGCRAVVGSGPGLLLLLPLVPNAEP